MDLKAKKDRIALLERELTSAINLMRNRRQYPNNVWASKIVELEGSLDPVPEIDHDADGGRH